MKYLSTFTGLGGFELAIHAETLNAECVGFFEYDKFAEETYLKNYPGHVGMNFGDIGRFCFDVVKGKLVANEARIKLLPDFDLLVGGPPCQDLSIARGNRKGLEGEKSIMFFAFEAILRIKKPKWFLMENVSSMSNENRDIISKYLGVEPVAINSDKFTPQKRIRNYWFNWGMPELPKIDGPRWPELVAWSRSTRYHKGAKSYVDERETLDGRANTLTTGPGCSSFSSKNFMRIDGQDRVLTPEICEQLQGLPPNWTYGVSDSQRYKQIGNAVNVPTVMHILGGIL